MKKYHFEYTTPISSGSGDVEAKNATEVKKQVKEFLDNDPILEDVKAKDIEIKVTEVKG